MADLDLTEAIYVARKALEQALGVLDYHSNAGLARAAVEAASPVIERLVREQASAELRAWADEIHDPGITGPRTIRRRVLMSAASWPTV